MTHQGSEPARYPENQIPVLAEPWTALEFEAPGREPADAEVIPLPQLLWPLEPRTRVFVRNLADLLLFRNSPKVEITAEPAPFWSDVFVNRHVSIRALADSALVHVFAVVAIVGFTQTYVLYRPPELHDAFTRTKVLTYEVSEYLPEVHTSEAETMAAAKPARTGVPDAPADPVLARQEIINVPPDPDNLSQTIVTPSALRIHQDVPLPNIVTAKPPKAVDVLKVANGSLPKIETPPEILAPKLKVAMAPPEIANAAVPKPVEVMQVANRPAPKSLNVTEAVAPKLAIGIKMPSVTTGALPAAAATPIQIANGRVRKNSMPGPEIAAPTLASSAPAPQLATAASGRLPAPAAEPSTSGTANNADSAQQIMALSTHPLPASGALSVPDGSRRGSFATSPSGSPNATGAPATTAEKSHGSGAGSGTVSSTPGIHVSAADSAPHAGIVASGTPTGALAAGSLRERMLAMAAAPPTIPPQRVQPEAKPDNDPTASTVFGNKRYYKLTVNMPNLTSASGSWVIRFAELHPLAAKSEIPLAAPVPLEKVDPAYPPDLINDKVEGTVILYAVIRADGSITDIKIINSVNQRLDYNAIAALHRWRFQPGTKENQAVDVEAVVQVPFKVKKLKY